MKGERVIFVIALMGYLFLPTKRWRHNSLAYILFLQGQLWWTSPLLATVSCLHTYNGLVNKPDEREESHFSLP